MFLGCDINFTGVSMRDVTECMGSTVQYDCFNGLGDEFSDSQVESVNDCFSLVENLLETC